jgi:DNA-binding beta-propeller fold protein YncE
VYVADEATAVVWRITLVPTLTGVAGVYGSSGFNGNGLTATTALLNHPSGLDYDSATNTLYIADAFNNQIRQVQAGVISLVLGDPLAAPGFSPDGTPAVSVLLNTPRAVRRDAVGQLFFDDTANNRVRTINASGVVTVAGGGALNPGDGGPATAALLDTPHALIIVPGPTGGDIYFSDTNHHRVRRLEAVAVAGAAVPPPQVPEFPTGALPISLSAVLFAAVGG